MQVSINNISETTLRAWGLLLGKHPDNTVFQSPEMYAFYQKVENFEPYVFIAKNEKKEINGVLLAVRIKEGKGLIGYFSSRVVVYGGPIISENNHQSEILEELLEALIKTLKHKSIFIQFRNFFEWREAEKKIFEKCGFHFRDRLNLIIDTSSEKTVWSDISESKKRQVGKGLKSGVKIEEPKNEDEVKQFYNLLFDLYKFKVKKPLPHWSFFKEFYFESKNGNLGIIRLIKLNQQIIGGVLSPVTSGKNIYEWYVAGLDEEYKSNYPSILSTWVPIEYAIKNDLHYFDFMGLGIPDKAYGVREFKIRFGGEMVNYGRFSRRNDKLLYFVVELGYNLFLLLK